MAAPKSAPTQIAARIRLFSFMEGILAVKVAQALFESYSVAATEYFEAAHKLAHLVGSHHEFAAAQQHAEQTGGKCRAARSALEKHRLEHGCNIAL